MNINVFLIDDFGIVREGLQRILNAEKDIKVIGNAPNGHDIAQQLIEMQPEIAILNVNELDSVELDKIKDIRENCPSTQMIIITSCLTSENVFRLLSAGATGYVLAESANGDIASAIRAVHSGRRYLSQRISDLLVDDYMKKSKTSLSKNPISRLSMREKEILQLVAEGKTSTEIAKILNLSSKTVNTYRHHIMEKLNIGDIPALVRFAIQNGLTPLYKQNFEETL